MNRKQMFRILGIPTLLSLLVIPLDVKADTLEELNQQKTELESRIQELGLEQSPCKRKSTSSPYN